MTFKNILLFLVIIVNAYFAFIFIKDLISHKKEVMAEPAKTAVLPISSAIIFCRYFRLCHQY